MKKLLTTLWIIIIAGTIFLAIHFTKPNTASEKTEEISPPKEANEVIIEKEPVLILENPDNSFQDYIYLADKYLSGNYLDNAIENYEAAYYLNNYSEEAAIKLSNAYLLKNQVQEANQILLTASNKDRKSVV